MRNTGQTPTAEQIQSMKKFAPLLLAIGAVLIYFGWVLLGIMVKDEISRRMIQPAEFTQGTIVDRRSHHPEDAPTCFWERCVVVYEFNVANLDDTIGTYTGKQRVNFEAWDRLMTGTTVEIRYNSNNPKQSIMEGQTDPFTPVCGSLLILAGLVTVISGFLGRRMDKIYAKRYPSLGSTG